MKIKSFSVVVFNHNIKLLLFSWSFAEKHSDTTKLTYFIIYWIFDYLGILRLLYCCLTFIIYKNDIINFKRRPRSSIPNWVCQLDNHLDVSLTGLWRNMMILTPQFINLLSKKNLWRVVSIRPMTKRGWKYYLNKQRLSNMSPYQQILGLKLPISWPHLTNQIVYGS